MNLLYQLASRPAALVSVIIALVTTVFIGIWYLLPQPQNLNNRNRFSRRLIYPVCPTTKDRTSKAKNYPTDQEYGW